MTAPEDDWWDRLYEDEPQPVRTTKRTRARRRTAAPDRTRVQIEYTRPAPERESIRDAAASLLPTDPRQARRWQIAAYWLSAGTVGWWIGMAPAMRSAYTDADTTTEGVWMGVGLIVITAAAELWTHRLRHPGRHPVIRVLGWTTRIPLASALLALALFTPDAAL